MPRPPHFIILNKTNKTLAARALPGCVQGTARVLPGLVSLGGVATRTVAWHSPAPTSLCLPAREC